jgi:hypothetical protein
MACAALFLLRQYAQIPFRIPMAQTNFLYGIFWDYPQFTSDEAVVEILDSARGEQDTPLFRWVMTRFLEHGRVIDTFRFFSVEEVSQHLPTLRLRACTRKKWQRMIEVYRAS